MSVSRYDRGEVPMAGAEAAGADRAGPPWPGGAAWVDGRYCPVEDAKISVLDLGVTRSDCTYDVVHPRYATPVRYDQPG